MDAQARRRVHFQAAHSNGFAAIQAITVLALVQTPQGGGDALQFQLPTSRPFLRHGLPLQGIHAR